MLPVVIPRKMRSFHIYMKALSLLKPEVHHQLFNVKGLPIVHHDGYVCDLPPKHRFPMKKFHGVLEHLIRDGVISKHQVVEPLQVTREVACSVHNEDYVDKFFSGKTSESEQRPTGFIWSPGLASRVRYETGGTLLTAQISQQRGLACSTAGGTHHAFPDRGAGFCLLNDLAITAQHLIDSGKIQKVLIVDLDVHQGDGTAFIFKDVDSVFTFSMHCGKNFPFCKQTSDLDIVLDIDTEDSVFLKLLTDYLPFILDSFNPDLVLYDAGVDPHKDDELGKLKLSDKGLYERDYYVISTVTGRGCPCATVIGGGYSQNLDELSKRHTIVHRAATKVWQDRGL